MSKIICEICGTAYPETSTQCPICGYVRSAETAGVVADDNSESRTSQYTYVKGGRFSKANVKKRNRAQQKAVSAGTAAAGNNRQRVEKQKKGKKNIGFILISIILLLLVLVAVVYLTLRFFWPSFPESAPTDDTSVQQPTDSEEKVVSCTGLALDVNTVTLSASGEARMIYAAPAPANTTDVVEFRSSDESIVSVSENGKIVAVAPGEVTITVVCGSFQAQCQVICEFEPETEPTTEQTEETTEPTEETTQEPTIVLEQSMFNRKDFSLLFKGEKWKLYTGEIDPSLITWSSDNPNVAVIENGVVKAVGKGTTKVYAEYNGVKISCIVRCNF